MGAKQELATIAKLQRAAAIGGEIDAIAGDIGLQKLSKQAWLAMAGELAGETDINLLRAKIEALPYLWRLVGQTAQRWHQHQQDRPVPDPVFSDGDNATSAYAERLMGQISVGQASAVAAVLVAEMAEADRWGRLGSFDEVAALLEPLERELEQLDDQLAAELRVRDLAWAPAGASLRAGTVVVALTATTAAAPASALAQAARDAARGVALAA